MRRALSGVSRYNGVMIRNLNRLQIVFCSLLFVLLAFGLQFSTAQLVNPVAAQENTTESDQQAPAKLTDSFKTDATSTYTVTENGSTRVEHRFTITNQKPTTYLKQYLIKLQFPSVTEITASNQGKSIVPDVQKEGPATTITLNFDDEVVGEGKTRVFTIGYTTKDVSVGSGNVLELRIPAIAGAQESSHQVFVNLPVRYAFPVRANPKPDKQTITPESIQLHYSSFPSNGLSALFGSEQMYRLKTKYLLKNSSSSLGYTQIALPPDTSYQRMQYSVLEPKPEKMKIDEDGNWIATYLLPANTTTEVRLDAHATVTLEPDPLVPVIQPKPDHLNNKPFWQSNSATIQQFAQPALLRDVYDAVIHTLSYDTERVANGEITTRLGAEDALANPTSAVCQEYADLLIAGWRSVGIPARRLNGYAYSENKEIRPLSFQGTVLHAWVDYFDQASGRWRMVDPTWEDTTGGIDYFSEFDLNHIVLSINGVSSSDPAPAGSYSESPDEAELSVEVSEATVSAKPTFSVTIEPATAFGLKIPGSYQVTLSNQTGRAWYDTHVTMAANSGITISPPQQTSTFLPFEDKQFSATLVTAIRDGWKKTPVTFTLVAAGESEPYVITQENLTAAPALVSAIASINPSTPLGVIAFLSSLAAGSLLVFRRKRKTPLRWQSQRSQKAFEQLPPSKTVVGENPPNGSDGSNRPVA